MLPYLRVATAEDAQSAKARLPTVFYQEPHGGKHGEQIMYEVGPAVPWLRAMALFMPLAQGLLFTYLTQVVQCPETGAPTYAMTVWVVAAPVIALRSAVEIYCLKACLTVYVKKALQAGLVPFQIMGFTVSFMLWLGVYTVFSVLNGVDMVADTIFAGVYTNILGCESGAALRDIWATTYAQSMFSRLGLPAVELQWIIASAWALTFLQALVPVVTTLRRKDFLIEPGYYSQGHDGSDYVIVNNEWLNHEAVCEELAGATGNASLQALSGNKVMSQCTLNRGNPSLVLGNAAPAVKGAVRTIFLGHLMENSLQANLQTTIFSMLLHIGNGHMGRSEWQSMFSIALGMCLTMSKITELALLNKIARVVQENANDEKLKERFLQDGDEAGFTRRQVRLRQIRRDLMCAYGGFAAIVLTLTYAAFKLAGSFSCPGHIVNVSGCVVFSRVITNSTVF